MSWYTVESWTVMILALTGFFYLAWSLWSEWRHMGWLSSMTGNAHTNSPSETSSRRDREDDECYRECIDYGSPPGVKNQRGYCANVCGMR